MTITGFKTEQGSLYWIDPQGFTRRFKRSPGAGYGEIHKPHACIYLPEAVEREARSLPPALYRIYASVLKGGLVEECSDPQGLREAIDRGDRVCLAIMERTSQIITGGGPVHHLPSAGLYPFEQGYMPDAKGIIRRHYHLGNRITHLFRTVGELVREGYPIHTLLAHGGITPAQATRPPRNTL